MQNNSSPELFVYKVSSWFNYVLNPIWRDKSVVYIIDKDIDSIQDKLTIIFGHNKKYAFEDIVSLKEFKYEERN